MPDLSRSDLADAGLLDDFDMHTQGKFISPAKLGMPSFSKGQLERISKMLAQKNAGLTLDQIDQIISRG